MACYAFIDTVSPKSGIDVHCTTKDVMAKGGTDNDCQYVICLKVGEIDEGGEHQLEALTLYVMKTNIRKNDRKTDTPYTRARKARDTGGTGSLSPFFQYWTLRRVGEGTHPVGWTLSILPLKSPSSS
jgi:hypothetical protein